MLFATFPDKKLPVTGSHCKTPSPMRWTFWAMAAFLLADSGHAATETAIRSIDIAQDSDAYVANVVMFAPVATEVAWQVLTDFDQMAKWVPNVRESKVIAREPNAVTIEQNGVAKFGILSFSYVSVRHIEPDPPRTIRSTQIKGNMRRLESLMTLAPDGNGTKLVYHLEMVPGALAATVMSKEFLEHELREQFGAIIGEMVRRSR
jgi:carbon monoxide dehydrogenase subunit G